MLSEKFTRMDNKTRSKITDICEHTYKKCKPYFKNTRVALDIGSKEGLFAQQMCKDFDHIHTFDMRYKKEKDWEKLLNNKKVTRHRCAIGNMIGEVEHSGAYTNVYVDGIVPTVSPIKTIDSFKFDVVDFIKIDVEGAEYGAVKGIAAATWKILYVELSTNRQGAAPIENFIELIAQLWPGSYVISKKNYEDVSDIYFGMR